MHNVEKSKFRKGEYIGYGGGAVWHIRNYGKGNWKATPQGNNSHKVFTCATLRDVSAQLDTLNNPAVKSNPAKRRKPSPKTFKEMTKRQLGDFIAGCHNSRDYGPDFTAACNELNSRPVAARKTNPVKRVGVSKSRYVSRPSQASGHAAPSKRLKARRKKAVAGPAGYFPNPSGKPVFVVRVTLTDEVMKSVKAPEAARHFVQIFRTEKAAVKSAKANAVLGSVSVTKAMESEMRDAAFMKLIGN